ncbi:peptidoglycan-binding domain-containing protein [Kineosporia succinea]|uniref:Peptidoglycan hydrolase-like protein with peptidoglycan-binding domain n=1 Tax=Kineosporia succinea TaxID=84632 RepID=A0ABT9PCR7_9ACTN|nr:peptidoglycan-binding domain-containing protein [Kineosporia succinea]MDP9830189.1 peptidoglycan hydrolase-like protein with peptidoglycan-binding domain [Kineosporia succinea]
MRDVKVGAWARRALVSGAAVVLALGTVGGAAPAQASVAQGYIAGSGVLTDDWGDEGTISATVRSHSNAVMLWQSVLVSDGYLTIYDADCWFGADTKAATKKWQDDHGLEADGSVGPLTFGKADDNLVWSGGRIVYQGKNIKFNALDRDSNGYYYFYQTGDKVSYTSSSVCD